MEVNQVGNKCRYQYWNPLSKANSCVLMNEKL